MHPFAPQNQCFHTPESMLSHSQMHAFALVNACSSPLISTLLLLRSIAAILLQHCCQTCAALRRNLCSIAAEVVQDSCLNCATMLHNLFQAAAQILAQLSELLIRCLKYSASLHFRGQIPNIAAAGSPLATSSSREWTINHSKTSSNNTFFRFCCNSAILQPLTTR